MPSASGLGANFMLSALINLPSGANAYNSIFSDFRLLAQYFGFFFKTNYVTIQ
jgi:hypothetical protein